MIQSLTTDLLSAVNHYLSERLGLYFNEMRYSDLERGLNNAAQELGYANAEHCINEILEGALNKQDLQTVVRNLTVGETYFFRDQAVFIAMEEKIIPELLKRKRKAGNKALRIWSAGCSTGEEPYSIAISLSRTIPDIDSWQIHLIATDINTRSLEKAHNASYGSWSFRTMPSEFFHQYFQASAEGQHKLNDNLRKYVKLSYLNLAEDEYPTSKSGTSEMDIVFCRNVLIYFTQQRGKQIADKLADCLAPGGSFITSASDSSRFITQPPKGLQRVGSTIFVKSNAEK